MCAHYLVDADFCNVASGWEKGIVEKNVQDSRRRVWVDAGKVSNGMDAPTRNGINVPKWKRVSVAT